MAKMPITQQKEACMEFDCQEENCVGKVSTDPENSISVQTGCRTSSPAFVCNKCGRLYWGENNPVSNRCNDPAFYINGQIGIRDKDGEMNYF